MFGYEYALLHSLVDKVLEQFIIEFVADGFAIQFNNHYLISAVNFVGVTAFGAFVVGNRSPFGRSPPVIVLAGCAICSKSNCATGLPVHILAAAI
jgi:hypothetical protein